MFIKTQYRKTHIQRQTPPNYRRYERLNKKIHNYAREKQSMPSGKDIDQVAAMTSTKASHLSTASGNSPDPIFIVLLTPIPKMV